MPKRPTPETLLTAYNRKRDFTKTAEPAGTGGKAKHSGKLRYLVQKHAARRLHYDFRLEMDGVLKSWAVTRGPSLSPADKRLAVHVEDHPLAYGDFEGTIPQGQYGGGTVMLWDTGWWESIGDMHEAYRRGRLDFILHGERLRGHWHLVRMGGRANAGGKHENWLLIKSDDEEADAKHGESALEKFQTGVISGKSMELIARTGPIHGAKVPKSARTVKPAQRERQKKSPKTPLKVSKKSAKPPPAFVSPQLATLVTEPPEQSGWVHEIKFDGYRLQARLHNGKAQLLTRSNKDWTGRFPDIAAALTGLPVTNALLDGEVVVMDADGAMSFHALQEALSTGHTADMHYFAFDLLYQDGKDLTGLPLRERKARLRAIMPDKHARLHFSEDFSETGHNVLEHACGLALEGIISKKADAPYRSGRGQDWLKSKCVNEQEMVLGGFTLQPKHPNRLGALLMGYYDKGALIFAGKVGTGYTQAEAAALLEKMRPLAQKSPAFASLPRGLGRSIVWLKPQLAAQIGFTEWTADGRLRHPVFHGLREDKPAREIGREHRKPLAVVKTQREKKPEKTAAIPLTHPDKIIEAASRTTKQMLADYYDAVAERMLPHIAKRPISLMRCPDGIGKSCFFQRHASEGFPKAIELVPITLEERRDYLTIHDRQGLRALVQMGVVEIHVWGAMIDNIDKPDRLVFDLDPAEDVAWPQVKKAALLIKDYLEQAGLQSLLKTTGGKGLHLVVPIAPRTDWDNAKDFTRRFALTAAQAHPRLFTVSPRKTERVGKIFIDYLRNGKGASAIAPYAVRARAGLPVALPLAWSELSALKKPNMFTMKDALRRMSEDDPWAAIGKLRQKLPL